MFGRGADGGGGGPHHAICSAPPGAKFSKQPVLRGASLQNKQVKMFCPKQKLAFPHNYKQNVEKTKKPNTYFA